MAVRMIQITAHTRRKGHTAAAALAYRHGIELACTRTGEIHDFRARQARGHVAAEGLAGATAAIATAEDLAIEIERTERRKNSQLLRDVQVALPLELGARARETLAAAMAQALSERYRTVVSWAVHRPHRGDRRNHHAHLILPTRALDPDDPDGRLGPKLRELCERPRNQHEIKAIRETWVTLCNEALARGGSGIRLEEERPLVLKEPGEGKDAPAPEEGDAGPDTLPDLTREEVAVERREARKAGVDPDGMPIRELLQRVREPYTRAGKILVARMERHRLERQRARPEVVPERAPHQVRRRRRWRRRAQAVEVLTSARSPERRPTQRKRCRLPRPAGSAPARRREMGLAELDAVLADALEVFAEAEARTALAAGRGRLDGLAARLEAAGQALAERRLAEIRGNAAGLVRREEARRREEAEETAWIVQEEEREHAAQAEALAAYHRAVGAAAYLVTVAAPGGALRPVGPRAGFGAGELEEMLTLAQRLEEEDEEVGVIPVSEDAWHVGLAGPAPAAAALAADGYAPAAVFETGGERTAVLTIAQPDARTPDENRAALEELLGGLGEAYGLRPRLLLPVPGATREGAAVRLVEAAGGICRKASARLAGIWRRLLDRDDPGAELPEPSPGEDGPGL